MPLSVEKGIECKSRPPPGVREGFDTILQNPRLTMASLNLEKVTCNSTHAAMATRASLRTALRCSWMSGRVLSSQASHSASALDVLPSSIQPYARLARWNSATGTWLLAWPSFWSIAIAADPGSFPDMECLSLFGTGAVVSEHAWTLRVAISGGKAWLFQTHFFFAFSQLLRGAGCTINDLWDRDIDRKVERTRNRPIASGEIGTTGALTFLAAQLSGGLAILLQLNDYAQIVGASSLPFVATYPLAKRFTNWPQATRIPFCSLSHPGKKRETDE